MDQNMLITISSYIITAVATISSINWRIKELERKVEKHNNLVERMVTVEQSLKSAHKRMDEHCYDHHKGE